MPHPTLPTLFFAGTDTDVGKTYTAALVARELVRAGKRVGVYKPVASGCREVDGTLVSDDAVALWEAANCPRTLAEVCPQRFVEPLAPPEAAGREGKIVDIDLLRRGADAWETDVDLLIVEGAGGLLSPLADGVLNIDLVTQFKGSMLVIVTANRLGAIHQTLATCAAALHYGVAPRGIILCDPGSGRMRTEPTAQAAGVENDASESLRPEANAYGSRNHWNNAAQISRYCDVPLLGSVPFGGNETDVSFIHGLLR